MELDIKDIINFQSTIKAPTYILEDIASPKDNFNLLIIILDFGLKLLKLL